ncbi:unnamed protein product [Rotaria magnacalcarata]|uniref:BTB domain-containing protein n=1 Tax=Rotaria magnacalcarata TaxID=392030 RepID=A0A819JU90_9BILA|nr:unnamed protein product [Rotaria magnacalcarata]CAF4106494.1 unnamed protein product [Rotaria magnacalcarata]
MESRTSLKFTKQTPRKRIVADPIVRKRKTPSISTLKESSNANDTNQHFNSKEPLIYKHISIPCLFILTNSDIGNRQSFINIRSINYEKQRNKNKSSLDNRIRINVCGDRYETYETTLDIYPNTLLGNDKQRRFYYDKDRNEYFFDRHRSCFAAIFYYYQSNGRLRRPDYVPLDIFLEEVLFFQLGSEAFSQIRNDEKITVVRRRRLPNNSVRRFLWAITEYPDYSKLAKIVHIISLIMVFILTMVLAAETLPQYDNLYCVTESIRNITSMQNETYQNSTSKVDVCDSYFESPFFLIQAICVGFFTIEFLIRALTTPSLLDFIKSPMNWTDLIAIIPFYITFSIYLTETQGEIDLNTHASLRFLRVIRLLQVFKFGRIFKNVKSLRVFTKTVKQSLLDFLGVIIIITAVGFLFGTAVFYAENDSNEQAFDSIFTATYWGIITVISLGYGDIIPITTAGRIISCFCALCGTATMGILTSVLVGRYRHVYAQTIFIDEEALDFYKYFNKEDERINSMPFKRSSNYHEILNIENSNEPAMENIIDQTNTTEVPQILNVQSIKMNTMESISNQKYFILGYVKHRKQTISQALLEKINAIIEKKRRLGITLSLNIISDKMNSEFSTMDVKFQLGSSSSDEESSAEDNDNDYDNDDDSDYDSNDDNGALGEITKCSRSKKRVLHTFTRRVSETYD